MCFSHYRCCLVATDHQEEEQDSSQTYTDPVLLQIPHGMRIRNMRCSSSRWPRAVVAILSLLFVVIGRTTTVVVAQQEQEADGSDHDGGLLWSSTGGGWRAMFADIGYANIFRQAGLMDETSTKFDAVVSK